MSWGDSKRRDSPVAANVAILMGGLVLLAMDLAGSLLSVDAGEALTRNTVRLSLAWYFAALLLMIRLDAADWTARTQRGWLARWCWTWSVWCFWVHLAMAFHYYHDWSHQHAFETTREASGVGEGIYVSYVFTWLWAADMLAWWLWPDWYARRNVWLDRGLHVFMLFIVFNGMVVFETGPIRWAGVIMTSVVVIAWIYSRLLAKPQVAIP